ncbi:hypothetical protein HMPREF9080_01409 [Cardiobacterium valvarum F0432]|uniref:Deoxyribose-phosphate aldolase n=1 Tax=Cardiobacterium valvarum F0432 TaxID=797473 RepID=G9ZF55_9GAMM|nr:hypothetical protein [Cardiobacterium valvarum]EHM54159.1 hypothetical protein HMPREF9080_01409 [Cardiobacterium valvarum F0432]
MMMFSPVVGLMSGRDSKLFLFLSCGFLPVRRLAVSLVLWWRHYQSTMEVDMKLSRYIDHTLLAPQATAALAGTAVKVCTVIGFPLGADTSAAKAFAATDAVENGADELNMVMNIGLAKDDWAAVQADIAAVVQAAAGCRTKQSCRC